MTLRLKSILADAGIKQGVLAKAIRIPRSTLNGLINHNVLPHGADRGAIETSITRYLREQNAGWTEWFKQEEVPCTNTTPTNSPLQAAPDAGLNNEDTQMLLRKQPLTPQARRHFGLTADPFADPTTPEDVFLSPEIRYVRESMYQVARHGGFLGVVGESGAGKSTLREELVDRIQRDSQSIIVVEPYVLAMESNDATGKTLRAAHIAEAIMSTLAPLAKAKSSPEARFRQLHQALRDSARTGFAHVLLIEEAHSLPLATLKHLKRFRELKDGLRPLLAVILIGQPELAKKLSEQNPEVREVVQRIELIKLPPLDTALDDYLVHRFKRAGAAVDKVLSRDAIDALRVKLKPSSGANVDGTMLYPLAVHNAIAAAMNRAVDLGVPLVTGDVIRGV